MVSRIEIFRQAQAKVVAKAVAGKQIANVFQGPTRPGTDVEVFRRTGASVPRTSVSGGGGGGQIIVSPSGVSSGFTSRAIGDVVVPGTGGLTAREISQQVKAEARSRGIEGQFVARISTGTLAETIAPQTLEFERQFSVEEQRPFKGPVPRGASEELFRRTGRTDIVPITQRPTGGVFAITQEEKELGLTEGRGAFVVPKDISPLEALETGQVISGFIAPRISPTSKIFGLTREERETEIAVSRQAQKTADIVLETRREFRTDPESFIGETGVSVEEVKGGKQISLDPSFFETKLEGVRGEAVKEAKLETKLFLEKGLGFRELGSVISSGATLGAKLAVGTVEFGGSILRTFGQQDISEGVPIIGFKQFEFKDRGGIIGDIKASPFFRPTSVDFKEAPLTFLKEGIGPQATIGAIGIAGALTFGVKGFIQSVRAEGLGITTAESLSTFSPLSIKSGVFFPKIKPDAKISGIAISDTQGKITTRQLIAGGVEDEFALISGQKIVQITPTKGVGIFKTEIFTPVIEIRGGGGFVREGIRRTSFQGLLRGEGGEALALKDITTDFGKFKVGKEIEGFKGEALTQPTKDVFIFKPTRGFGKLGEGFGTTFAPSTKVRLTKFGGVSRDIPDTPFKIIVSGKRKSVFEPFVDKDLGLIGFRTPSTKFEFKPTTKIVELDIGKIKPTKDTFGVAVSGRKSTQAFIQSLSEQSTTASLEGVIKSIPKTFPTTKGLIAPTDTLATQLADLPPIVGGTKLAGGLTTFDFGVPRIDVGFERVVTGPQDLGLIGGGRVIEGLDFRITPRVIGGVVSGLDIGKVSISELQSGLTETKLGIGLRLAPRQETGLFEISAFAQAQVPKLQQKLETPTKLSSEFVTQFREGFGFRARPRFGLPPPPILFPPFLGGVGGKKRKQKKAKSRVLIRPSFTGIILGIEEAPIISPFFGVLPGQIRGLATGFDVPKRKKKKVSKKKTKKK